MAGTVTLDSAAAGLSGVGWPAAGGAAERGDSPGAGGGARLSRLTGPGAVAVAALTEQLLAHRVDDRAIPRAAYPP